MVILHIAHISNDDFIGVNVAVPNLIRAQSKYGEVALWNLYSRNIEGVITFDTGGNYDIDILPEPFNDPDIVVFHELYRPPFLKIYKQLKKRNIPYIIEPHGGFMLESQHKKKIKKLVANFLLFSDLFKSAKKNPFSFGT